MEILDLFSKYASTGVHKRYIGLEECSGKEKARGILEYIFRLTVLFLLCWGLNKEPRACYTSTPATTLISMVTDFFNH